MVQETKRVTERDPAASPERWVEAYGDQMFRYALARLRNRADAEDAVQAAFLAALESRHTFSHRSSFRTWLFGILKHKILDKVRNAARQPTVAQPEFDLDDLFDGTGHHRTIPAEWRPDPRESLHQEEFMRCLRSCLAKMPKRLSTVFELREIENMNRSEILETMRIQPNNYWVMLHRARLLLRTCIEANWFVKNEREDA